MQTGNGSVTEKVRQKGNLPVLKSWLLGLNRQSPGYRDLVADP
jgi:hypothetical protein